MKKVLYLGGTHADIPLISRIKEMGMYVITIGLNESGLGHKYSDEYIKADFSDNIQVLSIAKERNVDFIVPSCSDFATLTASYVSNELGLPGYDRYETSKIIHNKNLFRQFCLTNNINVPKVFKVDNLVHQADIFQEYYPLIVKPVDADSGKGISRVDHFSQLNEAIKLAKAASRSKEIVVEQFISGSKHAASIIIENKEIEFIFIDDEQYYLNKYMVAAASHPSKYYSEFNVVITSEIKKLIKLLNLVDGLLHVQFIFKDGLVYLIEACRRPPGEFYVKLVEYAKGQYYINNIIKGYLGCVEPYLPSQNSTNHSFIRQCVMTNQNGIVQDVKIANDLSENIIETIYWNGIGSKINNYLSEKLGVVFLQFKSEEAMHDAIEHMSKLITVTMENPK